MRIILYTGKGGVGKTTIAAATALHCASRGYRTMVMSTDIAHSLSDSFDIPIGGEPHLLAPNLWGQETDINVTINKQWTTIQNWVAALLAWRGMREVVANEVAVLPGMEELANLLYIVNYASGDSYDVIIVDSAPTGETLRLLSFPEILNWWMEKLFPIERQATKLVRPLLRPLNVPVPGEDVFDAAQDLFKELDKMRTLLTDPALTSIRLVLNPEKMVIKETQRTFTYLNLYGYATDAIICNRFIPANVTDHYFDRWKANQAEYLRTIEERFAPLPILLMPLMDREIVGLDMLRLVGDELYGSRDPAQIFFRGKPHQIEKMNKHYNLSFDLPNISREDIALVRNGDELVVSVGSYRRNIILPRTLANLAVAGARFENNRLVIRFGGDDTQAKNTGGSDRDKKLS